MKNREGLAPIIILLIIAAAVLAGGGGYFAYRQYAVPMPQNYEECITRGGEQGGGIGNIWCKFQGRLFQGPPQTIEDINTSTTSEILTSCDTDKQCPSGFVCDYSYILPKGWDESRAKTEGDQLCHKGCATDADCGAGNTCLEKRLFAGDIETAAKFCVNNLKENTQDWQTYRNEQYGFEVKYPSDYVIGNRDITRSIMESRSIVLRENASGSQSLGIQISVEVIFPDEIGAEYHPPQTNLQYLDYLKNPTVSETVGSVAVGDKIVSVVLFKNKNPGELGDFRNTLVAVLDWDNTSVVVKLTPATSSLFTEFFKIISTFKFISPNNSQLTQCINEWQKTENLGYSLSFIQLGLLDVGFKKSASENEIRTFIKSKGLTLNYYTDLIKFARVEIPSGKEIEWICNLTDNRLPSVKVSEDILVKYAHTVPKPVPPPN